MGSLAKTVGGGMLFGLPGSVPSILGGIGMNALTPKIPGAPAPIEMPDPKGQTQAKRRSLIEQLARKGRQSTILSDPGLSDSLG